MVCIFQILSPDQYGELDSFVENHPQGSFMQSSRWRQVKSNWDFSAVASRGENGEITGSAAVLIRRFPPLGSAMLYAPRGPVCDPRDEKTLGELKAGLDEIAANTKAHILRMDPDVLICDGAFCETMRKLGFSQNCAGDGFETIQPRFNYRLYLDGRGEDELFANLTQKTRYNVRIAQKKGVQVRVADKDALDDFVRLMAVTGERDGFSIRPKAYFARFLSAMGPYARLYMAYYEGCAVAGAVTTNFGKKTCYVYGASDNLFRNVMPNYLIQWEMIRWAAETGCAVYDFQGVSGNLSEENNPLYGLYRFKRGFGGTLDELCGEFDFLYRPAQAKFFDMALGVHEQLRGLRKKIGQHAR